MLGQLHDIDLQLLRIFVCVVECAGFSAAQGVLGITQSTISTQMSKLETRLGFVLCERGKGGFRLTPKGEEVLKATRKLFAAIESFKGEAQGMAGVLLGELHIGLSESLNNPVLQCVGQAVGHFRQRKQAVQMEMLSAAPPELERRLLQDQLHVAIGYFFSGNQPALDYLPLFHERQRLYCASGHALFKHPSPTLDDLARCDQVLHPYRIGNVQEPFRSPISSVRAEHVEASLAFILSGAHIGYLPEHIAAPWISSQRLHPLLPELLDFDVQFYLVQHRGRQTSDVQQAFVEDLLTAFTATLV
ncbi:MAG: LysR family transcriptional regulator [Pseudomonas sp.]